MAKTQRVVFTFDDRSLSGLKDLVEQGRFSSMADAVRDSVALNRALQAQARRGYTEVIVRDPDTGEERVMVVPTPPPDRTPTASRGPAYGFFDDPTLDELAQAQGIKIIRDISELHADFWPTDESVDDFLDAVHTWRRG